MIWTLLAGLTVLANVPGWDELYNGNLISAAFVMYDTAFLGWTVVILFMIYQLMLLLKTRNLVISFVTGLFFVSIFVGAQVATASGYPVLKPVAVQALFVLLVLELAAIIYIWFWK